MSSDKKTGFVLLSVFVLLVAGRDISYELFLQKKPRGESFAFWVCATVTFLSFVWVVAYGEVNSLFKQLRIKKIFWAALALGLMCAVIYITTFVVIENIDCGLFNVVDWGIAPVLTALIGIIYFNDSVSRSRIMLSLGLYIIGTLGLFYNLPNRDMGSFLIIGLLSPVFTAISFPLQKWLMQEDGGRLTRQQVTFIRFLPATIATLVYYTIKRNAFPDLPNPAKLFLVTSIGGFIPLILLCYALFTQKLARFAVWQFGIPAVAFFGTLYKHPENQNWLAITSCVVILVAILAMEWPAKWSFNKKEKEGVPLTQN